MLAVNWGHRRLIKAGRATPSRHSVRRSVSRSGRRGRRSCRCPTMCRSRRKRMLNAAGRNRSGVIGMPMGRRWVMSTDSAPRVAAKRSCRSRGVAMPTVSCHGAGWHFLSRARCMGWMIWPRTRMRPFCWLRAKNAVMRQLPSCLAGWW